MYICGVDRTLKGRSHEINRVFLPARIVLGLSCFFFFFFEGRLSRFYTVLTTFVARNGKTMRIRKPKFVFTVYTIEERNPLKIFLSKQRFSVSLNYPDGPKKSLKILFVSPSTNVDPINATGWHRFGKRDDGSAVLNSNTLVRSFSFSSQAKILVHFSIWKTFALRIWFENV